jgi:hypothetical protein
VNTSLEALSIPTGKSSHGVNMQAVKLAILLAPEQFQMLLNCAVVQATARLRIKTERETGDYHSVLTFEGTIYCPNNIDPSEWSNE